MMDFFKEKQRTKFISLSLFILVAIQQIVTWSVRATFILYEYNQCYFDMTGNQYCDNKKELIQCLGPTQTECNWGKSIKDYFFTSLLAPLIVLVIVLYFQFQCWCVPFVTFNKYNILKCTQFLWVMSYFLSMIFYFITAENIQDFSNRNIVINQQVLASCYVLGIISILIIINLIMFNYDLHLYYNKQEQILIINQQIIQNTEIQLAPNHQQIIQNCNIIVQMEKEYQMLQEQKSDQKVNQQVDSLVPIQDNQNIYFKMTNKGE